MLQMIAKGKERLSLLIDKEWAKQEEEYMAPYIEQGGEKDRKY